MATPVPCPSRRPDELEDRLRQVLRYGRTLTLTPARVTAADAAVVLAADWPERTLYDIALVCGLLNLSD